MTTEQFLKNLSVPNGMVDVVLDTDAYNEIDDQFAIAYMLNSPEKLTVRGITSAPFLNERSISPEDGMEKSYDEILKVLSFLKPGEMLAEREREVLELVLQNKKRKEIADELCLSENTIKTYTRTLYGKVGVSSREELYALLIK